MSTRSRGESGRGAARWYWCALPVLLGVLGMHGLAAGHGTTDHHITGATATTIPSQAASGPHLPTEQLMAASSGSASSTTQHPPLQSDSASLLAAGSHTAGNGHHGTVPEACLGLCVALLLSLATRLPVRRTPRVVALLRPVVRTLHPPVLPGLLRGSPVPRFTVMRC